MWGKEWAPGLWWNDNERNCWSLGQSGLQKCKHAQPNTIGDSGTVPLIAMLERYSNAYMLHMHSKSPEIN